MRVVSGGGICAPAWCCLVPVWPCSLLRSFTLCSIERGSEMARTQPQEPADDRGVPRRLILVRGSGGGGPPVPVQREPPISNAQLGVLIFIAFETMIFAGLVTAYWVLRSGSFAWPPPNLPRLPLAVTSVNTAMLGFSAVTMSRAVKAIRVGSQAGLHSALVATAVLGAGFLVIQGSEWARLIHQGLTLSSGSYGGTFYALIGLHALHVVGAVLWLLVVLAAAYRGRFSGTRHAGVTLCATYWYYVCALWVVLFGVVYVY
jgi:cytochrome c oxidase subunit III